MSIAYAIYNYRKMGVFVNALWCAKKLTFCESKLCVDTAVSSYFALVMSGETMLNHRHWQIKRREREIEKGRKKDWIIKRHVNKNIQYPSTAIRSMFSLHCCAICRRLTKRSTFSETEMLHKVNREIGGWIICFSIDFAMALTQKQVAALVCASNRFEVCAAL